MITLRLNPELEQHIENMAKQLGITKSELIRKSVQEYLNKISNQTPWELGKDLFGKYSSGSGNLSITRKERLRKKIRDKLSEKDTN